MVKETHNAEEGQSPSAGALLPRAHVLGYLTVPSTPTRVRAVTAIALLIVGYLTLVAALFLAALWVIAYPEALGQILRWFHWSRGMVFLFRYTLPRLYVPLLLCPCLLVTSATLLLAARFVRRGRRGACIVALVALGIVMLLVALGCATIGALAIQNGTGAGSLGGTPLADRRELLWLVAVPALIPVLGLLWDICGYLLWIVSNPAEDKPTAHFLPSQRSPDGRSTPSPS